MEGIIYVYHLGIFYNTNAEWFNILINTFVGKLLIVLMLILTIISAFLTLRINKPL